MSGNEFKKIASFETNIFHILAFLFIVAAVSFVGGAYYQKSIEQSPATVNVCTCNDQATVGRIVK